MAPSKQKLYEALIVNYDYNMEKVEEEAMLECMTMPMPFLKSFLFLEYDDCVKILAEQLPVINSWWEQPQCQILLYSITHAVIFNFTQRVDREEAALCTFSLIKDEKKKQFSHLMFWINSRWETLFKRLSKSNDANVDASYQQARSLRKLLKDANRLLYDSSAPKILWESLQAGKKCIFRLYKRICLAFQPDRICDDFDSKIMAAEDSSNAQDLPSGKYSSWKCPELEPAMPERYKSVTEIDRKSKCTCVMCNPSTPVKRDSGAKKHSYDHHGNKYAHMKNTVVTQSSRYSSLTTGESQMKHVAASPEKFSIGTSKLPVSKMHVRDLNLENHQKKYIDENERVDQWLLSPRKRDVASDVIPLSPIKTNGVENIFLSSPGVKRALPDLSCKRVSPKKARVESATLPDGKINAFAFMMKASKKRKY